MDNTKIRFGKMDELGEKGQECLEKTNECLKLFLGSTEREALEMIVVWTQAFQSAKTGYLVAAQAEGDDEELVREIAGRFREAEKLAFELTYTDAAEYAGVENLFFEKRTLQ